MCNTVTGKTKPNLNQLKSVMRLGFVRPTEIAGESINMHIGSRLVAWCKSLPALALLNKLKHKHITNDI